MWAVAFLAAVTALPWIELRETTGEAVRFESAVVRATVVIFISTVCPISNDYHDRFEKLHEEFGGRGVRFLFVYSNYNESDAEVRRHAAESRFGFPVYRDHGQRLAGELEAMVTPTAVVLDRAGVIRYRGAVDDALNPARVKSAYLARAIEAVMDGRDPSPGETKAEG